MSTIVVQNVSPVDGSEIVSSDVVAFDVVDTGASLPQIIIAILYPGLGLYELVYDGTNFSQHYLFKCSVSTITDGFHFELLRDPVWPDGAEITVFAAASDGATLSESLSYVLQPGQAVLPPPTPAVVPVLYPLTASTTCPSIMYPEQHFLDMFDRVFPDDYMQPLKLYPSSGYEIFQGAAALGARLSQAVERLDCDSFVINAAGGEYASGTVQFFRASAAAGSVTILTGSLVSTSDGNRDFVTLEDAVFTASDLGPIDIAVHSVSQGYEWNVSGQIVTQFGVVIPGEIDTCRMLVESPPFGDATIQVQQLLDTVGGRPPALDGLGADRGIERLYNESDAHYALRIRSLPDTVSPDAIVRNVAAYLAPLGITFAFIEEWQVSYQTCYDAPESVISGNPDYNPALFAYDDDGTAPGHTTFLNRWLDEIEDQGAFIIVLTFHNPLYDTSMAYDDPGVNPFDFKDINTGWQRGDSAFDTDTVSLTAPVYPGCYDGFDLLNAAAVLGLYNLLQSIKAGGVAAVVEHYPDYPVGWSP